MKNLAYSMCVLSEIHEKMCTLLEYYKSNQINSTYNTIAISLAFHEFEADIIANLVPIGGVVHYYQHLLVPIIIIIIIIISALLAKLVTTGWNCSSIKDAGLVL